MRTVQPTSTTLPRKIQAQKKLSTIWLELMLMEALVGTRDTPSGGNESCSSSWIEVQSIPNDICGTLIDAVTAGGGFCGPNGYCRSPVNSNGPAFCSCPAGFSPLDQSNKVVRCKPDFLLPSCHNGQWRLQKKFGPLLLKNLNYIKSNKKNFIY